MAAVKNKSKHIPFLKQKAFEFVALKYILWPNTFEMT